MSFFERRLLWEKEDDNCMHVAACPSQKLVAISTNANTVEVFDFEFDAADVGAARMTFRLVVRGADGNHGGAAGEGMFMFDDSAGQSGALAFTANHLLAVTNGGCCAVHLVDPLGGKHVGYLAPPGSVPGVRFIAVCGTKAAVTVWTSQSRRGHEVWLYEERQEVWTCVRRLKPECKLWCPMGLRFVPSTDASSAQTLLMVADYAKRRLVVLDVGTGLGTDSCQVAAFMAVKPMHGICGPLDMVPAGTDAGHDPSSWLVLVYHCDVLVTVTATSTGEEGPFLDTGLGRRTVPLSVAPYEGVGLFVLCRHKLSLLLFGVPSAAGPMAAPSRPTPPIPPILHS
jgi:hypothetical protein